MNKGFCDENSDSYLTVTLEENEQKNKYSFAKFILTLYDEI